jgi:hypothetical protein
MARRSLFHRRGFVSRRLFRRPRKENAQADASMQSRWAVAGKQVSCCSKDEVRRHNHGKIQASARSSVQDFRGWICPSNLIVKRFLLILWRNSSKIKQLRFVQFGK